MPPSKTSSTKPPRKLPRTVPETKPVPIPSHFDPNSAIRRFIAYSLHVPVNSIGCFNLSSHSDAPLTLHILGGKSRGLYQWIAKQPRYWRKLSES